MNPNYLNDVEKTAVSRFVGDKVMFDAVRKVLEFTINHQGVTTPGDTNTDKNWVFSLVNAMHTDEQLGAIVRASAAGLGYLSKGFEALLEFKLPETKKERRIPHSRCG